MLQLEGSDSATLARRGQAALALASSTEVFNRAAAELRLPADEVRRSSTLTASNDSFDITVKARADAPERAAQVANAVAAAAVAVSQADVQAQLRELEDTTTGLIQTKALSDPAAERARVTRLGEGLADNQSRVVVLANMLRMQEPARADAVTESSRGAAMVSGVLGGLLLGGLWVLVIGRRRGRVQSAAELARLYPEAVVRTPLELRELSAEGEVPLRHVLVAVDSENGDDQALTDLVRRSSSLDGQLDVAACSVSGQALRRAMRDPQTAVVLPVVLRKTQIQGLDQRTQNAPAGVQLLVLTKDTVAPSHEPHVLAPASS